MKKKFLRAMAILMVCGMLISLFCACANAQNKKAVATSGEYEIPYEQLRFVTMTYKMELDTRYGDGNSENGTIWDDPATAEEHRAELEELVWTTIRENYAILQACAERGIGKNAFEGKEIKAAVDEQIDALIAEYSSKSDYQNALKANYATENLFRFYFSLDEMKYLLHTSMQKDSAFITDEARFEEWLRGGNCAYVQHFMLTHKSDAEKEENRAILENARENLISGVWTLTDCINRANDDLTNVSPYFVVRNVHKDVMVDAAVALESVDDVSEIVEVDGALYVFVRMDEYNTGTANETTETALSLKLTSLLSEYQWAIVGDVVEAAITKVNIEINDYGKSIDLVEME